jgi:hypothetical protein
LCKAPDSRTRRMRAFRWNFHAQATTRHRRMHWSRRDRFGKLEPRCGLGVEAANGVGQEVLLPLSVQGAKQVQKVIGEFNRSRDFLVVEDRQAAEATLQ